MTHSCSTLQDNLARIRRALGQADELPDEDWVDGDEILAQLEAQLAHLGIEGGSTVQNADSQPAPWSVSRLEDLDEDIHDVASLATIRPGTRYRPRCRLPNAITTTSHGQDRHHHVSQYNIFVGSVPLDDQCPRTITDCHLQEETIPEQDLLQSMYFSSVEGRRAFSNNEELIDRQQHMGAFLDDGPIDFDVFDNLSNLDDFGGLTPDVDVQGEASPMDFLPNQPENSFSVPDRFSSVELEGYLAGGEEQVATLPFTNISDLDGIDDMGNFGGASDLVEFCMSWGDNGTIDPKCIFNGAIVQQYGFS